ncbi:MFS transporter [Oryzibacter oryziterrae]|uniref:MFS transporter n=1 Tax=Oryzibacter oryziterrae TaxID=2766474 RepID=UPI001F02AFCF|nr:MFS transporter [Oryzibacter oryziterrae]
MIRLLIVMLAAFVAQTTEYLPIGLVPAIRQDLGVSEAAVGALVTGYAWIAALTAIPLIAFTLRLDRRMLFVGLIAVVIVSNLMGAIAPNYGTLATTRVLTALTHGVFWSILAPLATRLAPDVPENRALAIVFAGISIAIVAGVPAANAIGQSLGWRAAFAAFAGLGLVALIAGVAGLPAVPPLEPRAPPSGGRPVRQLAVIAGITTLSVTAHFCGYTYIVALLDDVAAISPAAVPWYLLLFGLAGAGGTIVSGWFPGRPSTLAMVAIALVTSSEASLALSGRHSILTAVEMVSWGSSVSMLIMGLQGWVLTVVPETPDTASAVYVAAFNGGIGLGAALGGLVLAMAAPTTVLFCSAVLGIAALIMFSVFSKGSIHDARWGTTL